MKLNVPIGVVGMGLSLATPAYAQQYFNCEYFPRCEAIQNYQCEPRRDLKDKLKLVRSHNSAEEVEGTWAVLSSLEPEYCSRLGGRGDIVREFLSFKTKAYPRPHDGGCANSQACVETFVKTTRERWERDALEAKIKADVEARSRAAIEASEAAKGIKAAPTEPIVPEDWQTTIKAATPTKSARGRTVQSR